ncbi:uncharacterized protein N7484_006087 [Penicillium longicatenatum]|uniref:uncharacterized protein n=1 Tax=Penicillium longicatenatum TaxID=1561947 RepID=UPI0025480770|nr:uncharacterized protein N7484_006087 [Penicillium longicatenatum]KAJ5643580.1 hypothetical protein N7484_006087 [Penicillium longicatenatum]
MPKVPPTARRPPMPARVLRPQAGTGVSSAHMARPQPTPAGRPHPYASQSTQTNTMPTIGLATKLKPQEVNQEFEIVHANCTKVIRTANERQQQLRSRFAEQQQAASDAAQQFRVERGQLQTTIRQIGLEKQKGVEELREAKEKITSLQQQLDVVNIDVRNRITRDELHRILREIHTSMVSATDKVVKTMSESEKVNLDSNLPFQGFTQDFWAEQVEQLDLPDELLFSTNVDMSTSVNPQEVSQSDQYAPVP